ncbi:MAG: lysozyme [Mangrovibacterium sp.]
MKKISRIGLELIKRFEGFKSDAYQCPAGILTIGYGTTKGVKLGDTITEVEAEKRLAEHLFGVENTINAIEVEFTQNQFDALCSFAYNCGSSALLNSTLLRKIKAEASKSEIASQFARWNKAAGIELAGLTARRTAEAELFNS